MAPRVAISSKQSKSYPLVPALVQARPAKEKPLPPVIKSDHDPNLTLAEMTDRGIIK